MAQATALRVKLKLNNQLLRLTARKGIQIIKKRTARGIDAHGNKFKAYSTDWFARPLGGLEKHRISTLDKLAKKEENVKFFTSKKGKLWALIKGYDFYKKTLYPDQYTGEVNLSLYGEMLGGMVTTQIDTQRNTFTVGFSRDELSERAYYVNEEREFLGFTNTEKEELERFIAKRAEIELK